MNTGYRVIAAMVCLLASLCASAQAGDRTRKIVLPNPELIHCRSAQCSQLWKQDSGDGGVVYPAQVLTDFVNGEVVGLTAVYDKSISEDEIRSAIDALYPKAAMSGLPGLWRVESRATRDSVGRSEGWNKTADLLENREKRRQLPCSLCPHRPQSRRLIYQINCREIAFSPVTRMQVLSPVFANHVNLR
jgi:hypothetical protein